MPHQKDASLPTEAQVDEFFRGLEAECPFPEEEIQALAGADVVEKWQLIGATQSVSWVWVMLCELALVSFLTPNARFFPLASFPVFSVVWMFFVHPGSCHTSNLLRLYHNCLHGLEMKANAARAAMRAALQQQALPGRGALAVLNKKLQALKPLQFRFGTGSLEGIGLKMAFDKWRTAAGGFLVEGSQFITWLTSELGINVAIATQLWERMAWQRDTVNQLRSFGMSYPFLGVLGALHVEDIWGLFAYADPLGLRSRICMMYTRPVLKRAREIEDANTTLGNTKGSDNLEQGIIDVFWPVYQAHATEHVGVERFTYHLGYPFINYDFPQNDNEAAKQRFMQDFDTHVQLQEEAYLVHHEESKREGKLKGKHLRHALNWTNMINARTGVPFNQWNTTVSENALKAALLLGTFFETVSTAYAQFVKNTQQQKRADRENIVEAQNADAAQTRTHSQKMTRILSFASVATLKQDTAADLRRLVFDFAVAILRMRTAWLDSTSLRNHSIIRDRMAEASNDERLIVVWRAMAMLQFTQLGCAKVSVNPSGSKRMFYVNRFMRPDDENRASLDSLLEAFEVPPASFVPIPTEVLAQSKPVAAPSVTFPAWDAEAAGQALIAVQNWMV